MAEKKSFLLRLDRELYDELRRQAASELRSTNGQIEYVLRWWIQKQRGKNAGSEKMSSDSN
jgi:hypothetical protein